MAKVFLHVRQGAGAPWDQSSRDFLRLPVVGEYVTTDQEEQSPWYRVELVVHAPSSAQYAAEVYATKVDYLATLKAL